MSLRLVGQEPSGERIEHLGGPREALRPDTPQVPGSAGAGSNSLQLASSCPQDAVDDLLRVIYRLDTILEVVRDA
jgi:hypothetical protein